MATILKWTRTVSIRRLHKLSEASKSTATAPLADNESTVPKPFSEMPGESSQSYLAKKVTARYYMTS